MADDMDKQVIRLKPDEDHEVKPDGSGRPIVVIGGRNITFSHKEES